MEQTLHELVFDKMDETEKEKFAVYCWGLGTTPDEFIKTMAKDSMKSVEHGWEGYKQCAPVLYSNWGFNFPLDTEHARGKVLIRIRKKDNLGPGMGEYLVQNYTNSELIIGEGSHISPIYTINEDIVYIIS